MELFDAFNQDFNNNVHPADLVEWENEDQDAATTVIIPLHSAAPPPPPDVLVAFKQPTPEQLAQTMDPEQVKAESAKSAAHWALLCLSYHKKTTGETPKALQHHFEKEKVVPVFHW